jgi:hypothetical protein
MNWITPRSVRPDWPGTRAQSGGLIGLFSILVRNGLAVRFSLTRNLFGTGSDFLLLILAQNQSAPRRAAGDATRRLRHHHSMRRRQGRRREVQAWRREVTAW